MATEPSPVTRGASSISGLPAMPPSVVALHPRTRSYTRLASGMCSLGLPLAVEPKTSPSSLNPKPQELLLVLRKASNRDPSGMNRKNPFAS